MCDPNVVPSHRGLSQCFRCKDSAVQHCSEREVFGDIAHSIQHTLSGVFSAADVPGAVPNAGNMGVVR